MEGGGSTRACRPGRCCAVSKRTHTICICSKTASVRSYEKYEEVATMFEVSDLTGVLVGGSVTDVFVFHLPRATRLTALLLLCSLKLLCLLVSRHAPV